MCIRDRQHPLLPARAQRGDAAELKPQIPHVSWSCQAWLGAGSFPLQFARGGTAVLSHPNPPSWLFAQVDFALQQEEAQAHELGRCCVPACCEPWSLFARNCSGASSPSNPSLPASPSDVPFPPRGASRSRGDFGSGGMFQMLLHMCREAALRLLLKKILNNCKLWHGREVRKGSEAVNCKLNIPR